MKNFNNFGVHWKIQFLAGGGFTKKQYRGGDCLKRGAWTVFRFKEEGACQGRGGLMIPQCTLCSEKIWACIFLTAVDDKYLAIRKPEYFGYFL